MEEKKTNRLLLSNGCRNAGSSVSLLSATLAKKSAFCWRGFIFLGSSAGWGELCQLQGLSVTAGCRAGTGFKRQAQTAGSG